MQTNMRKLNDIPFTDLCLGDTLISGLGKKGVIIFLDANDDYFVTVRWEDGSESGGYHTQWGQKVMYVGRGD